LRYSCFSRDEIAGCIEKAYTQIQISEAARMLFFDSQLPMQEYAAKVNGLLD
jgi:26S proteasome regulatory subunit N12